MTKQVILGAHFPGVNNHTAWSDPAAGSQIEFSSFAHLARTAEAGLFDFFFLAGRCGCGSSAARSTTWTWSAARTR